jgi:hypothetical protein
MTDTELIQLLSRFRHPSTFDQPDRERIVELLAADDNPVTESGQIPPEGYSGSPTSNATPRCNTDAQVARGVMPRMGIRSAP